MIDSIKHKGLKDLWEKSKSNKLPSQLLSKIKRILFIIDTLEEVPEDLYSVSFYSPHPLKGNRAGQWALKVSGNYRITFGFDNKTKTAFDIDFEDYH